MASEQQPCSGDTSLDSKNSGGSGTQKSMLELLTITDAAVKALNKSTHSTSSHGSKKSQHSDPLALSVGSDQSAHSGHSGQLHSSRSGRHSQNGQPESDRSEKSTLSQAHTERSVKSQLSVATGGSARSEQSDHTVGSSQSGRSVGDIKVSRPTHDTSRDSGVISKTHTLSEEKSKTRGVTLTSQTDVIANDDNSDVSTTASDVLIRSTLDKSERSILAEGQNSANGHGSSSVSSKCSKTSFGMENFNSSGPQKVKISKKHLREIKPPFEDGSPRSSASSDGKVPSALLRESGKLSGKAEHGRKTAQKKEVEKEAVTSSNDSNGDKFPAGRSFPRGIDAEEQFKVEKVRKSAEKALEDVNIAPKPKAKTSTAHVQKDDKFDKSSQSSTTSSKNGEVKVSVIKETNPQQSKKERIVSDQDIQFRSTPRYYVERHTPQKTQARIDNVRKEKEIPEKKNLLQELEDSIEIITAHAPDSSSSSSQPEIVTVQERIVTVSAKTSVSPVSVASDRVTSSIPPVETYHSTGFKLRDDKGPLWEDKEKLLDDSSCIPPALNRQQLGDDNDNARDTEGRPIPARFQWFSRQATGHGLQQGAPVSGPDAPDKHKQEDVRISHFKLSDKEKLAKETFTRRQGGPIRRVVQPHIVGHDSKTSSSSGAGELKSQQPSLGQANEQVLTAAAAASAAVAATQPFLKAQQEMELRMSEVLAKINELQSQASEKKTPTEGDKARISQLERQLADMTEKRIEYMERLQEQQMAMQAKLLSMTRDSSYTRPYQPRSYSPESHTTSAPNKAFSKTVVTRQPPVKHSVLDLEEADSPLDTPAPRGRAPRPTFYDNSDIEYRIGKARSPKARSRSPKAKSPKGRARSPAKEKQDRGILHQILASADSPPRDCVRPPLINSRVGEECESPNVRKAKGLIDDLSHIKEQVKGLVEDKERWQSSAKDASMQEQAKKNLSHTGPSPLDSYLQLPEQGTASPYKSIPDLSFSKINAPVLPGFKEAQEILHQVQQNRGFLESNFEAVMRARQEVEVYSMLEAVYNDSTDQEKARIKKMVDKSIQRLRREVEREVTDDMVISEIKKKGTTTVPGAVKIPEPEPAPKPAGRFGYRGRTQQSKVEQKPDVKKSSAAAGKRTGAGGKENVQHKFYRPPPKKTKSVFEDEETMTRIYGKASYQKGRTTVKDPYLHFQNQAKQKAPRPTGHVEVTGTERMSSKTQTSGGGVRQFYFNPVTGSYIPIASAADAAPVPGQLIPMAVPLGGPRMDPGLKVSASMTSTPMTLSPGHRPQVTAEGNVSMVSLGMVEEEKMRPELGKQVLPAVDIDTDLSEMSEIVDQEAPVTVPAPRTPEAKPKKHVQIVSPGGTPNKTPGRSPGKAHYEVIYHEDDTLVEEDADVETATGLELPGYQPEEVPAQQYDGPTFPPKMPSADRQFTADLIAEDIRRRDLLQNKATEWIEQELMARIISEVYPLKDTEEPHEISHVVSESSEDSMAEEREKSMFVMDSIGHRGMQLFIDAGCPVDNTLVNRLIDEVLQEKVRSMLGQRPDAEDATQHRARVPAEEPQWEEPISEEVEQPSPRHSVVSTPEPTPKATPLSSPPRRASPARTPLASPRAEVPRVREEIYEPETPPPVIPPPQPMIQPAEPESEPESSASYDIQEELARLADKLRQDTNASATVLSRHDVATPPESPKPEPEPAMPARPLTPPELSPRLVHEEPFLISQNIVPAGASLEQTPSRISKTKSESPKSATSPQVTELAEEELAEDQPKPVVFTVAETQTNKLEETRKSRSPSPAKPRSRTPSESSYTESSSISDTFNECVSEGQWLINKSDGEVADFPINEAAVRERMLRMSHKRVDVSSASTWKDIDDVDLDQENNDASKSEGEFLYRTDFPPEKDPVLDMLARLQSAQPKFSMYQMSQRQVTDVLTATGKSEGEVLHVSEARHQHEYIPERETIRVAPKRSKSPKSPRTRSPQGGIMPQRGVSSHRKGGASRRRSQSPVYRSQSPTRVSFEDNVIDQPQRSGSPTRGILKRSSSFDNQTGRREDYQVPVRDSGRSHTTTGKPQTAGGRIMQGERQPQPKGMIGAGARTMSPGKSGIRRPIKSSTMPEARTWGSQRAGMRVSSEDFRESMDQTGGASYFESDYGGRNMTPDQMNLDALIQSGYLSQSFSQSEQSGRRTGQSSLRNSADVRQSRDSAGARSLGYSYGTESSISMSELKRLATEGTGKLKMSLTIPGTDADDTDVSEIDITDGGNTK